MKDPAPKRKITDALLLQPRPSTPAELPPPKPEPETDPEPEVAPVAPRPVWFNAVVAVPEDRVPVLVRSAVPDGNRVFGRSGFRVGYRLSQTGRFSVLIPETNSVQVLPLDGNRIEWRAL